MSNYRRVYLPGGMYFFTVVTFRRQRFLTDNDVRAALEEYRKCSDSGTVYDDPRVAVGVGCFDEVGAQAEA